MRDWGLRFDRMFANTLRRSRPRPGDKWFVDEMLILSANSPDPLHRPPVTGMCGFQMEGWNPG